MAKLSKRQKALAEIDRDKFYGVDEAIGSSRPMRPPSSTRPSRSR